MEPNISPIKINKASSNLKRNFMVVAVIIVMLISVTLLTVAGLYFWQKNTIISQVKDDLNKAASSMTAQRNQTGAYPSTITDILALASKTVKLSGDSSFDGTTYCITGSSLSDKSIILHVDSLTDSKDPQSGSCTSGTVPLPSVPGGLSVAFASSSSIKLTWNVAPYATKYTLQCAVNSDFSTIAATVTNKDSSGLCDNLKPNTKYYCRVKATNQKGDSGWSTVQNITTLILNS